MYLTINSFKWKMSEFFFIFILLLSSENDVFFFCYSGSWKFLIYKNLHYESHHNSLPSTSPLRKVSYSPTRHLFFSIRISNFPLLLILLMMRKKGTFQLQSTIGTEKVLVYKKLMRFSRKMNENNDKQWEKSKKPNNTRGKIKEKMKNWIKYWIEKMDREMYCQLYCCISFIC